MRSAGGATAFVMLAACSAPQASTIDNRVGAASVDVRLARVGEVKSVVQSMACANRGAVEPDLVEPIARFARAQLVSKLDPDERTGVPIIVTTADDERAPIRPSVEIRVDPRSEQGQLRVSAWWRDHGGHALLYCVHVRRDARRTTVLLDEVGTLISDTSRAGGRLSPRRAAAGAGARAGAARGAS